MQKGNVWLAGALLGDRVKNSAGENLGKIEELVIDPVSGAIRYAVLSFGGFLGMGDKLFAIPWSALKVSPARDYVLLDIDKETLERAPGFDRGHWPNFADTTWQNHISEYYSASRPPVVHERTVYVERPVIRERKKGMSVLAGIVLVVLLMGALWLTFLVSTRGWDEARNEIRSSMQSAAYAMKEESRDAALTAKIKTALSLSKRIPADQINVDSRGDIVTLRGEVQTEDIRGRAGEIARDVPGVREVHNHLYVMNKSQ